jgi:hypothetical protein
VIIGENEAAPLPLADLRFRNRTVRIVGFNHGRRLDVLVRSLDLEDRISDMRQSKIFALSVDAARRKAREIIRQNPQNGFIPIIENWRQRPDGQIEFAVRHLLADG